MGRRLKLKANFLPINVNLDTTIFHYDLQVCPQHKSALFQCGKANIRERESDFLRL